MTRIQDVLQTIRTHNAIERTTALPLAADGAGEFPRVLIVYLSCINEEDQHGVSIRNWFADWPREKLAQIYSGNERGVKRFCGLTYKLGAEERRFGHLFFRLRGSSLGESAAPVTLDKLSQGKLPKLDRLSLFKHRLSNLLVNSGFWELLFKPVLSPKMLAWVRDFQPQVIYCQGYSLSFAWLPVMLQRQLGLPICFQTGDDWPTYLYRDSIISWVMRPVVHKAIRELVTSAMCRFANGEPMATEYAERYGVPFEPLMMADSFERFRTAKPRRTVADDEISIVYTGGLSHNRWVSIAELCGAMAGIRLEGRRVVVSAFASLVPPEAISILGRLSNLQMLPSLDHNEVPSVLKGADLLFLPETMSVSMVENVRLSISTKAHLYMMSERPVLVYGSPVAGVVEYARREGWGYIVDQPDPELLVSAVRILLMNQSLRQHLVDKGVQVALRNHDGHAVRSRFLRAMQSLS